MGSYTILTPPPYFPLHISPLLLAQQALWYFLVLIAVLVTKLSGHKKVFENLRAFTNCQTWPTKLTRLPMKLISAAKPTLTFK